MASNCDTASSSNATGSGRTKVALGPGRSLMDWIRLTHEEDLAGTGGQILQVSPSDLENHATPDDAWICIKGNVYNVTRYLDFHPGGEDELMRGVGSDATDLFNSVHPWVNYESMLAKCRVGRFVRPAASSGASTTPEPAKPSGFFCMSLPKAIGSLFGRNSASRDLPPLPTVKPEASASVTAKPDFSVDWSQDDCTVSVVVTCSSEEILERESIAVDVEAKKLRIKVKVGTWIFFVAKDLSYDVYLDYNVSVNSKQKTVTVRLVKETTSLSWDCLGSSTSEDGDVILAKDYQPRRYFRDVTLEDKQQVTHDTYLFTFKMPKGTLVYIPVGQHVSLRVPQADGSLLTRSYTPVVPWPESGPACSQTDGSLIHLIIKIYDKGRMTQYLDGLNNGDKILLADSVGSFVVHHYRNLENLVLLGAGTGFTPMVRMIQWALQNCMDLKRVRLMSFHKTLKDVIWRDQLEALGRQEKRFVHDIILSDADESWTGKTGRVRSELLRDAIPSESEGRLLIGICGPPPFTSAAARLLEEAGYSSSVIHRFES